MKWVIVLILLLPIISAQNISVNYPNKVCIGEEFEVNIETIFSGVYDIKIDILQDKKRLARIWNEDKWASTMYYLNGNFNSNGIFKLKAEKIGNGKIIIKFRNDKIITFSGYEINIINNCDNDKILEDKISQKNTLEKKDKIKKEEKIKKFPEYNYTVKKMKPIILATQTIKTKNDSKNLDTGYAKYSIVLFCVLLAFLYFKKPRENKNEFS